MSRQFSIPTVLRMVPSDLLAQIFTRLGVTGTDFSWEEINHQNVEPALQAIHQLQAPVRDHVETELRNVHELACDSGMDALIEAAVTCGDNLVQQWPEGSFYHRAAWACLNRPNVVEWALRIHQVKHLSWWRKRRDLPRRPPSTSKDTLMELQEQIGALLQVREGRGGACTAETFSRNDGTQYFFVYPDDFVQNVTTHNEQGILVPQTIRRTFDVAFACNWQEGSLEIYAKVQRPLKIELEELFVQIVFDHVLDLWRSDAVYVLDGLLRRDFPLVTDPADGLRVSVRQLRLGVLKTSEQITLRASSRRPERDVYDMVEEYIDSNQLPLTEVCCTLVTFRFEMLEMPGRKAGSFSVDVASPCSSSLRNLRPDRIALARKYLIQWGIDRAEPDDDSPAKIGA